MLSNFFINKVDYKICQLGIPKWGPICKPNPETGSRDYKFLNPGSRDWKSYPGIAITNNNSSQTGRKLFNKVQ